MARSGSYSTSRRPESPRRSRAVSARPPAGPAAQTPAARASVVHIDDALVALNKPAGLSLATRRAEPAAAVRRLVESLPAAAREAHGLRPEALWLVHRLDLGTSGLVLLARTADAHRALARALTERRIEKVYLALVWGHPRPRQGTYGWALGPDRRDRRRMKVDPAGRVALTRYSTLAGAPHVSLVELRPETGRTHQLRVHLAHAGHWIVGDDLYGGPRHRGLSDLLLRELLAPPRPLLHAWRLELPETDSTPALRLEAPLPEDFRAVLDGLGVSASSTSR